MLRYEIYQIYNVFCVDEHDNEFARTRLEKGTDYLTIKNIPKLRSNTVKLWKLTLRRKLQHTI